MASDSMGEAQTYNIKRVEFLGRPSVPVLMQNLNGPCPLLAIANVLSLRNQLHIPAAATDISTERLTALVAERLLDAAQQLGQGQDNANLSANMHDCLEVLPKLTQGLDVNVRFNSPTGFEFTKEIAIFDLLGINLVHGWLVDQQDVETSQVLGARTYNQAVEILIAGMDTTVAAPPEPSAAAAAAAAVATPAADATAPAELKVASGQPPVSDAGQLADLLGLDTDEGPQQAPSHATAQQDQAAPVADADRALIEALDSLIVAEEQGDAGSPTGSQQAPEGSNEAAHLLSQEPREVQAATSASEEQAASAAPSSPQLDEGAAAAGAPEDAASVDPPTAQQEVAGPPVIEHGVKQRLQADLCPTKAAAGPVAIAVLAPTTGQESSDAPGQASEIEGTGGTEPSVVVGELSRVGATPDTGPAAAAAEATVAADFTPAVKETHQQQQQQQQQVQPPAVQDAVPSVASSIGPLRAELSAALLKAKSHTHATHEALVVREFLEQNASQLTVHGIAQIAATLQENGLAVFFRNNHFNCMFKHGQSLYLLLTDLGYLGVPEVVWERLDTVDGDTQLCGPDFLPHRHKPSSPARINMEALAAIPSEALAGLSEADAAAVAEAAGLLAPPAVESQQQQGSHHHYHVDADLALAMQLQQEEEESHRRESAIRAQAQAQAQGQGQQAQSYQQLQQQQSQQYYQGRPQQQYGYAQGQQGHPQQHGHPYGAPSRPAPRPAAPPPPAQQKEDKCSIM